MGWDEVTGTDRLLAQEISRSREVLWIDPPVPLHHWLREHGPGGLLRPVRAVRRSATLTTFRTAGPPWPNRFPTWLASAWRAGRAARAALGPGRGGDERPAPVVIVATPQPRPRPHGARVYFATDDFAAGAELMGIARNRLERWEHRQLAAAQARLAISPVLAARWSAAGHDAVVLPNGCDPGLREKVRQAVPAADVRLTGPVAGVVGQLSARLDLRLLEAVAEQGMALLLVGPIDPAFAPDRVRALLARPNVQWVGRQPVERLPTYLRVMDVGLTPYRTTAFNQASIPLKTMEYLAAGVPVVSTPLRALDLLPGGLVATASTPDDFAKAAHQLVTVGPPAGFADASLAFARANSWSVRADALLAAVENAPVPVKQAGH